MIKLTTLGSGTFFVTSKVSASAFVVEADGKRILIDCGPGTLAKLGDAGIKLEDLDYIFITHMHPDHTSDLFPLFMNFRLNDTFNDQPIDRTPIIYGPTILPNFMLEYSHLTQLHSVEGWNKIEFKSYLPEFDLGELKIKTYKVIHRPFKVETEGYAIRFEFEGKVLAFSGDTADCPGVRDVSTDADLFVCDCSFPKTFARGDIHLNTTEIGEIAAASNVKEVLLDHFYPQYEDLDLISEVAEAYSGKISKAVDLEVREI